MKSFKSKLSMIAPVLLAAALGTLLSQAMMPHEPVRATSIDDVQRLNGAPAAEVASNDEVTELKRPAPVSEKLAMKSGAGYQPPRYGECDCDCLDEKDIRKIVSDEFNNQKLAEAASPHGYTSAYGTTVNGYHAPSVQYHSVSYPATSYSQSTYQPPASTTTVVRRGIYGRRVVTKQKAEAPKATVCRTVNGVTTCYAQ